MDVVRWREPAAFKRASRSRRGRWWPTGLAISTAIVAIVLMAKAFIPAPNAPGWPMTIVIALGCALVQGFGIPIMTSIFPSEIIVSPKGINRNGINGLFFTIEFWPWDKIAALTLEEIVYESGTFRALVLQGHEAAPIGTIGLSTQPPLEALKVFLAGQGKPLSGDAV